MPSSIEVEFRPAPKLRPACARQRGLPHRFERRAQFLCKDLGLLPGSEMPSLCRLIVIDERGIGLPAPALSLSAAERDAYQSLGTFFSRNAARCSTTSRSLADQQRCVILTLLLGKQQHQLQLRNAKDPRHQGSGRHHRVSERNLQSTGCWEPQKASAVDHLLRIARSASQVGSGGS